MAALMKVPERELHRYLSSIKFALYRTGQPLERRAYGKIDRIGLSGTSLTFNVPTKKGRGPRPQSGPESPKRTGVSQCTYVGVAEIDQYVRTMK